MSIDLGPVSSDLLKTLFLIADFSLPLKGWKEKAARSLGKKMPGWGPGDMTLKVSALDSQRAGYLAVRLRPDWRFAPPSGSKDYTAKGL